MASSEQHKPSVPTIDKSATQRPKTLVQRLSSGIVHVLPPLRSVTPRNESKACSSPASNTSLTHASKEEIITGSASSTSHTQPCPYDPETYHSFASIEKRRCSFCGMRGPKIVFNEPCEACRTGGPDSHFPSGHSQVNRRRHSAIDPRQLAHLGDSSSTSLLGPRPVTPERAAKRIGSPPRVSRLPPGIIRLPVVDAPQAGMRTSSPSLETTTFGYHSHSDSADNSSKARPIKKPESPKLHHIHGLPNSENFPFVHKHEIPKHAIALGAGSTSPLSDRSHSLKSSPVASRPHGYSDTVRYGGDDFDCSAGLVIVTQPQITTIVVKEAQDSGKAVVNLHTSPLDTVLAGSQVYRKRSPQQTSPLVSRHYQEVIITTDSSTTFGSQDTTSTRLGDVRLELKGGNTSSNSLPKLRGGSGHTGTSTDTFSFKLKRWLLTCHGPCPDDFDANSDADLPPARIVSPSRVARVHDKMNGRASLPAHLCRRTTSTSTTNNDHGIQAPPSPASFKPTICGPSPRPKSTRLSLDLPTLLFHRTSSPIQAAPLTPTQVLNPPFPHLRGGGSPSPDSGDRLPPTLFYLAGGTGRKPISFSEWKQRRPAKRMGGLLGMAVFGKRYGMAYRVETTVRGERDVEVECSASIRKAADDGVGMKGVQSDAAEEVVTKSTTTTPAGAELPKEDAACTIETAPPADADPVQQPPTPALAEPLGNDEVPLCSGALPVNPVGLQRSSSPSQALSVAAASRARDGGEAVKVDEL